MGAWGAEAFYNDAAQDLLKPLRVASSETEIDADLASEIVVVAECVATMRGHPQEHLHGDVYEIVEGLGAPSKTLYRQAQEHLAMVWKGSELKELWEEDDPSAWNAVMTDLTDRLAARLSLWNLPPLADRVTTAHVWSATNPLAQSQPR